MKNNRAASARILAAVFMLILVGILIKTKSETDIGSSFMQFYTWVAIVITGTIWILLEARRFFSGK